MDTLFTKRKKAQAGINDLGGFAIAILIGAVILGLGGTILDKIQTTQTDAGTTISNNESFVWAGNNTFYGFLQPRVNTATIKVYCNATVLTLDANYTATSGGVTLINITTGKVGMNSANVITPTSPKSVVFLAELPILYP